MEWAEVLGIDQTEMIAVRFDPPRPEDNYGFAVCYFDGDSFAISICFITARRAVL